MNPTAAGQRLLINRSDMSQSRLVPDPDAPAARPLAEGQARLQIDQFALTANNVTYAAFGDLMQYWQFFPSPEPGFGCLPVWGFATVVESRAEGVVQGRRLWGYWPAGTHLVVQPARAGARGFVDAAPHRAELHAVYNQYNDSTVDGSWQPDTDALQAVLRPLFMTSFLIDDFFADNDFFGAAQLLLSSASSKTAFGTAFCLAQRRGTPGAPRALGLTSAANAAFTRSLGCYDDTLTYDDLQTTDASVATAYVDFAGNAALRSRVHHHFAGQLVYSSSIGGTHWSDIGPGSGLPGPRPVLFFAPAQIKKRSAPAPQGWGRDELERRMAQAWGQFLHQATRAQDPWVHIVQRQGMAAAQQAWLALVQGRAAAREGLVFSPQPVP